MCVSYLSTKGDTCCARASPMSQLKQMLAVTLHLLYLDERAKFWGPPVIIGNGLLYCPLLYWHTCNKGSK
jgi:hypothetical protein